MKLIIDPKEDSYEETTQFINLLYRKQKNIGQSRLNDDNNINISNDNSNIVSIVVRDGETAKTVDVKETLKELGFNYYAKTKSGKQDPRWTQTTDVEHWNTIKDNQVFNGLNIWTSGGGST